MWEERYSKQITLHHGTTAEAARSIKANGIDLSRSRVGLDFGPGFYMTTLFDQASEWARKKSIDQSTISGSFVPGAVLTIQIPRDDIADLQSMAFVSGDRHNEAYWEFVAFCRRQRSPEAAYHSRERGGPFYDMVIGPVATIWQSRLSRRGGDQVSLHTERGARLIETAIRSNLLTIRDDILTR